MRNFIGFCLFWLLLFGCSVQNRQEEARKSDSLKVIKDSLDRARLPAKISAVLDSVLLEGQKIIVVVGEGMSNRSDLAQRKALMDAQNKLYDKLASYSDPDSSMLDLSGSRIISRQQYREGERWHTYVVLAYKDVKM